MFGWGKKKRELETGKRTVYKSREMTETVKADLRKNIGMLKEVSSGDFDRVYDVAVRAFSNGSDLHSLSQALLAIEGMSKRRASEISHSLASKAIAIMVAENCERMGIKYAIWLYSGAPCETNPKKPTDQELQQNEAHKAANGKMFYVGKGMFLDGKWTRPGYEDGCKCVARPMIAGLDGYDGGKPEGFIE
jgi:hypothetical protein